MSYYSHVAIIPARKNSKGFPMKNRLYFNKTAKFVKSLKWFEKIILTSDDKWFKGKCNCWKISSGWHWKYQKQMEQKSFRR